MGQVANTYNNTHLSEISTRPIGVNISIAQNQEPIISFNDVNKCGTHPGMSNSYSNITRFITESNESTSLAKEIKLSNIIERLNTDKTYNSDMKQVVLDSINKASTGKSKIEVLEKGLAFLETEKQLSVLVQEGEMPLDEAQELLTQSLTFGCSKEFSLDRLNMFNESLKTGKNYKTIQEDASKILTEGNSNNGPIFAQEIYIKENMPEAQLADIEYIKEEVAQEVTVLEPSTEELQQKPTELASSKPEIQALKTESTEQTTATSKPSIFSGKNKEQFNQALQPKTGQTTEGANSTQNTNGNPTPKFGNLSPKELMNGQIDKNWEIPTSNEKSSSNVDSKFEDLKNKYKSKLTEAELGLLKDLLDFETIDYSSFGNPDAAKAFLNEHKKITEGSDEPQKTDTNQFINSSEFNKNTTYGTDFQVGISYDIDDDDDDNAEQQAVNNTQPQEQSVDTQKTGNTSSTQDANKATPQDIKEEILTIATNISYKANRSSEERRKMITDALPEGKIDNATLENILSDERCSRGVKVALLESKIPMYQKVMVLQSNKAGGINEIINYCQEHKNLKEIKNLAKNYNNNKETIKKIAQPNETSKSKFSGLFVDDYDYDKGFHKFTISEEIIKLKDFSKPEALTPEQRSYVLEDLNDTKSKFGDVEYEVNLRIDLASAVFEMDDEKVNMQLNQTCKNNETSQLILDLGELDEKIKDHPAYGLALAQLNKKEEFQTWCKNLLNNSGSLIPGPRLNELRERVYVEGTTNNPPTNGIPVPADVFNEIQALSNKEFEQIWNAPNKQKLGEGSFGAVYSSDYKINGKSFVLKEIKNPDADIADEINGNNALFEGINKLDSQAFYTQGVDFVTKYHGYFKIEGKNVLVYERAEGKDFQKILYGKKPEDKDPAISCTKENIQERCMVIAQMGHAIAISHEAGVVNRDIKPENLMVHISDDTEHKGNKLVQTKMIDLGTACDLKDPKKNNTTSTGIGTPTYMAPEMINNEVKNIGISPAADVYSYGISIVEAFIGSTGNNFYEEQINEKFSWKIAQKRTENILFKNLSKENFLTEQRNIGNIPDFYTDDQCNFLQGLLKDCLNPNPTERPSAAQVSELVQIFSSSLEGNGEIMSYTDAKKLAEEDHPKAIPMAIRNMISNPNEEIQKQGIEALKKLILSDPSYMETETFEKLEASTASKVKESEEYKSALERLNNKEVKNNASITENATQAPKVENSSSIQPPVNTNSPNETQEMDNKFNIAANIKRSGGNIFKDGGRSYWAAPKQQASVQPQVGHSADIDKGKQTNAPIPQNSRLNIDLDNEFAGAAIIQELETILSDNYGALTQAQDFMLSNNYDVHKLNEFLSFAQESTHTPKEIEDKAHELFK